LEDISWLINHERENITYDGALFFLDFYDSIMNGFTNLYFNTKYGHSK